MAQHGLHAVGGGTGRGRPRTVTKAKRYLPSLRRCTRVRRSILRCFFFDMRLRRFLMTEPNSGASFHSSNRCTFAGGQLRNLRVRTSGFRQREWSSSIQPAR